jgi:deoxyribonuclease V
MHQWDLSYKDAILLQKELAAKILIEEFKATPQRIAGIDLAYHKKTGTGFCSIIVLAYPGLEEIETVRFHEKVDFPYIPGLLSFREGPLVLATYETLKTKPDLLIFDGHGVAHPRRLGIASHIGLFLGLPSIGCAKSKLFGSYDEPGESKGSTSILTDSSGEQIGTVLRTRDRVKPVFISPGHMSGFQDSVRLVLNCTGKYRIPEPTRLADIDVAIYKREFING